MKNVLIYGLKDPIGGVERIVFDYVRNIAKSHTDICFDFLIFSEKFSLESDLNSFGCNVIYLPSKKNNYNQYKEAINKVFTSKNYTAVWGNYSGLTNIDLLKLAKKYKVPIRIAHSHVSKLYWGSNVVKYIGTVLHNINKILLPLYATQFWACSQKAGAFMFPKPVHKKIHIINNAIDTSYFFPDNEKKITSKKILNIPENVPVIGHIGRMCTAKNQIFLLEIMKEILKQEPTAKLLFVGDGELGDVIHDKAKQMGITDSIIFTGHTNQVAEMLNSMDVFVLPSESEGFPVVAVEAQACGVPCVVSDVVTNGIDISKTTKFVSIQDSADKWANIILNQRKTQIENATDRIVKNGFEIANEAHNVYLKLTEVLK